MFSWCPRDHPLPQWEEHELGMLYRNPLLGISPHGEERTLILQWLHGEEQQGWAVTYNTGHKPWECESEDSPGRAHGSPRGLGEGRSERVT